MRWSWVGWILVGGVALLMARPAAGQDAESCQMCHSEPSFFKNNPDSARLVVSEATLSGSVHGPAGLRCGMCHPGMATFPHPADAVPMECGACHAGVRDQYVESLHGYAVARGNPRAPTCVSCHGSHDVRSSRDPASPTHKVRLPSTCAACHGEAGLLTDQIVKLPQSFTDYAQSIHGMGRAGASPPRPPAPTATASTICWVRRTPTRGSTRATWPGPVGNATRTFSSSTTSPFTVVRCRPGWGTVPPAPTATASIISCRLGIRRPRRTGPASRTRPAAVATRTR